MKKDTTKVESFDFLNEVEIATSGSPTVKDLLMKKFTKPKPEPVSNYGKLTAEVITEARLLADKQSGFDIEPFYTKHGINCPVNKLLLGKLDKDGRLL